MTIKPHPSVSTPPSVTEPTPATPVVRTSRSLMVLYAGIVLALTAMNLGLHGFNGLVLMDITIGRWILVHGHVPLHNHWTQAMAGRPFSDTEWLFGVWVALAYQWGGRLGVFFSMMPFLAVTALFVGWWAARVRSWRGMVVAMVAGAELMIVSNPRPQWMSYAAFALGLWAIQQARRGRWTALGVFLAVIPVWTNMHASVVLAPALLLNETLWGRGRYRWRMVAATLGAAGLTLCRVGGAAAGGSFISHVLSPGIVNVIQEWGSPNFHTTTGLVLLPAFLLAWAVLLPWAWRTKAWASVMWLLLGPLAAFWAVRFAPYMVLGVVAVLADSPFGTTSFTVARPYRFLAAGAVVMLNVLCWSSVAKPGFFAPHYPVTAMTYLQRHHAHGVVTWGQWGDAANFVGVQPWVNSQAQLWARAAWWMPYVQAHDGSVATLVPWVRRWDPHAQWILWPVSGYGTVNNGTVVPGWQSVYRERTNQGVVEVWRKSH